ncbi:MAG: 3-methyl-2-oxobutanoate hydroxymethyltransferase [Bdellovibrionota bacterium]
MKNIHEYKNWKREGRKIVMLTCYDTLTGRIVDQSDVDMALVGDSVAMVLHGFDSTIHATSEMMELHTAAVARGVKTKLIVADLPFLSFRKGVNEALEVSARLLKAGAHAVKLEGVSGHEDVVKALVESGIPVMGHLGLTPQSALQLGGHKVQGRVLEEARKIEEDAKLLENLGCFALVLECVPSDLGRRITREISIPTIGIGAGIDVDGQVLVMHDMLGLQTAFKPKFLRHYFDGEAKLLSAFNAFSGDVKSARFPSPEESYGG